MLKITQIKKSFSGRKILNISEFSIHESSIVRISGENGTGKTTFLLILGGIDSFEGEINLEDISVKKERKKYLSNVYFVGTSLFLYDFLTGKEMLELIKDTAVVKPEIEKIVQEFLALSGLERFLGIYTREMSLGTQQKLGIAMAVLSSPKLLLLDEPFVNLDHSSKKALMTLLKKYSQEKGIVIYSSHSEEDFLNGLDDRKLELKYDMDGAFLNEINKD